VCFTQSQNDRIDSRCYLITRKYYVQYTRNVIIIIIIIIIKYEHTALCRYNVIMLYACALPQNNNNYKLCRMVVGTR